MKKILIIVGVIVVLLVSAYLLLPRLLSQQGAQTDYQTEAVKKGSLTAFVGTTGSVEASQSASLAWQTSGQVEQVLVEKGQVVEADEVLARLSPDSLSQNIIQAQAELVQAQTALDEVMNNREARANARLALIEAQQALEDAEKESQSKLYQRASQNTIDIAKAHLITAEEALDSAESQFSQVNGLGDSSPVYAAALSNLARARQERDRAEYNLRYTQELPDALEVEKVYTKLELAQAKLLAARQEWERIKDGPDPNDITAAETRLASVQATLDLVRIAAPFTGTVTQVDSQVGDLVNAGSAAFRVDNLSRLLVKVQVSEVDINRVEVGQGVLLTFDAIMDKEYAGVVTDIASSGTSSGGAVNFTVTIEVANPDEDIRPGMTAAANIAVSQLNDVLLVPSRAVRTVAGRRVVYVLRNNFPMMEDVELGASSNAQVQITDGNLKEGDLVILNPPSTPLMGGMGMRVGSGAGMSEE